MTYSKPHKTYFYMPMLAIFIVLLGTLAVAAPAQAATLVVTKPEDTNDGVCDLDCSLREAVDNAASGDKITFHDFLINNRVLLNNRIIIDKDLTINGDNTIIIDGQEQDSIFFIAGTDTQITLKGLTIQNGYDLFDCVVENEHGSLIVINSTFINNRMTAICNGVNTISDNGGDTTILDSIVESNEGGGIRNNLVGEVTIQDSFIRSNNGIGIRNSGSMSVIRSSATDNAENGINNNGKLDVSETTISGNQFSGILNTTGELTIINSIISENSDPRNGGGIVGSGGLSEIGYLTIIDSIIQGNSADNGGGIHIEDMPLTMINSLISENTATQVFARGGGIFSQNSRLTLINSMFSGNHSEGNGGSLSYNDTGSLVSRIINTTMIGNTSDNVGGAMYLSSISGETIIVNSTISGNYSQSEGGGLYLYLGNLTLNNTIVYGNESSENGDDIYLYNGTINTSHSLYSFLEIRFGQLNDNGGNITFPTRAPANFFKNYQVATVGNPTTAGNFQLRAAADAVDMGKNTLVATEATLNVDFNGDSDTNDSIPDLLGADRIAGNKVDMGAYEFGSIDPSTYDVVADNRITPEDAIFVINRIGTTNATADVNNDGTVNAADVNAVINNIGQSVP